jgi:hypothetical protein
MILKIKLDLELYCKGTIKASTYQQIQLLPIAAILHQPGMVRNNAILSMICQTAFSLLEVSNHLSQAICHLQRNLHQFIIVDGHH